MINQYLLDHDMTERDIATMLHWKSVYDAEVERVARVLNNWNLNNSDRIDAEMDSYRCI